MKSKNAGMLLLTSIIWGTAFVAQSVGMDHLGPFSFNGIRCIIGGIALLPCIWFMDKMTFKAERQTLNGSKRDLIVGGVSCGLVLFAASSLQQIGIQYTTAGKAGFVTSFYIVLVPVLSIFLKKKTGWKIWIAVMIALVGLYFLCITESFDIGKGDVYIFLGAMLFSLHILVIDYFSPRVDGVKMSCIQFFVAGALSVIPIAVLETVSVPDVAASMVPLLYAGVLSCAVAYTLQIIGQKNMNPAIASLILSLESCMSVLAGWLILGELLTGRELFGCVLMFGAIILAQLPGKRMVSVQNKSVLE